MTSVLEKSAEASPVRFRFAASLGPKSTLLVCTLLGSIILAGVIVGAALFAIFDAYSALPFWDQWQFISPAVILAKLFEQHNEHRALLTKLITLLDEEAFGGGYLLNFVAIYLTQAVHAALLILLGARAGLRGRPELAFGALVTVGALFTLHQYENLVWGFQTQFVIVFAAATGAFLSLARYAETQRPIHLALTILASLVATCEMANGVLVGPIAVAMAAALRMPLRATAMLALAAALLLAAYLLTYAPVSHHSNLAESLLHALPLAAYVLTYVGGIMGRTLASGPLEFVGRHVDEVRLSIACGAVICLANLLIVCRVIARRADIRPAVYALLATNAFIVATATITGLGRVSFGLEQALASRYSTGGAIMLASTCLLALILTSAPGERRSPRRVAAVLCFALLALLLVAQARFIRGAEQRRITSDLAASALLTGVADADALQHSFLHADYIQRGASYLKSQKLSIYADPWAGWLGHTLSEVAAPPQSVCAGRIDAPQAVLPDGARVTGVVSASPFLLRPRIMLIDGNQRVVGYGFVHTRLDLVRAYRPLRRPVVETAWAGHVKLDHPEPPRAVLMDRNGNMICFAGSS
jgi:hypothetical protein